MQNSLSKKPVSVTPQPVPVVVTPQPVPPTPAPIISDPIPPTPVSAGFLVCPIKGNDAQGKPLTSRTAKISSILDHSGTAIDPNSNKRWGLNAKDQKVIAFNGEVGDGDPCAEAPLGYTKKVPAPFFANGEINYIGAYSAKDAHGPKLYLNYDGHAGYDFAYPVNTLIVAPADGQLFKAAVGKDPTYNANWDKDHSFYIKHANGFMTWYRHCDKLHPDIEAQMGSDFTKSCEVKEGQTVAYLGKVGTFSAHLHFEVLKNNAIVDPYKDKLWKD